ncbi:MAG: hypothetical protein H6713_27145 [Myxococcales bacterium]|nr:hypothetical protein [Myxococcales bacterium]
MRLRRASADARGSAARPVARRLIARAGRERVLELTERVAALRGWLREELARLDA